MLRDGRWPDGQVERFRRAAGRVTADPVVTGGMPGWQITQIALGAALVAAVIAVLLNRTRTARRLAHPAT
ncbi:MAG TPA: hypothetical protein VJ418_21490 [Streptosporangiaceae bacterium]|jgi:hypothetical protein|nr:hypothetical protein [Streptosporangiaceae bacterium]HJY67853.1 hypothetical protein [Streptosporangiaceae bacterium]